jgi:thiamine biosynthesis lipoprotein
MTEVPRRSWVEHVMGMPVSLLARGHDLSGVENSVRTVYDELRWVDAVFSPYEEDSEVSKVARGTLALADAHPLVQEVARRCEQWREATGGLFDATRPDGRWDPSGLVKGWAVERAARHLGGGADWCVNAGGDVHVTAPSGEAFRVGIQDPFDEGRIAAVVACPGGGVATSGTAARGAHLYDPRTGTAATALASVTVVGPSLETADVLATAAFVGATTELLPEGYAALTIDLDGSVRTTPGWSE